MPLFYRFLAYSLAGCISLMTLLVLPALVGVLVDTSALSEQQAGWAVSAGFLGGAMASLVLALRMHHLNLRRVALFSFAIAIAGDAASAFLTHQPYLFMAMRGLAGIAAGSAYTIFVAAFARERHAERGYGMFITLQFLISGAGLFLLPYFSAHIDAQGMYIGLALLNLVGMALCLSIPMRVADPAASDEGAVELKVLMARATLLAVLAFVLFEASYTSQFTYVERFGVALSLSDGQIGLAMLVGSLAGIPGAFTIVLTGSRFGYVAPIALGVGMGIAGLWLLSSTQALGQFMAASCLLGFSWAFCLPYIQALLAALDRGGSALAAGAAASTIGGSIGPAIAAGLLGVGTYVLVFQVSMAGLLIASLCFILAGKR